ALVKRVHDAEGAGQAGDPVGEPEWRQGRRAVRPAGHRREAAHRLGNGAEARSGSVGPELAEAGGPEHHQTGVVLGEPAVAEAPTLQHAGTEVLYEHVRPGHKFEEQLLRPWTVQVQRDAALV